MQLAEHATAELLNNDQFITWILFEHRRRLVDEERVKFTVRVEMMIEWRGGRNAARASIERRRRV